MRQCIRCGTPGSTLECACGSATIPISAGRPLKLVPVEDAQRRLPMPMPIKTRPEDVPMADRPEPREWR